MWEGRGRKIGQKCRFLACQGQRLISFSQRFVQPTISTEFPQKNSVLFSRGWVHSSYNWHKEKREAPLVFSLSPMTIPKELSNETSGALGSCREYSHGEKDVLRHQMITPYHAKYFAYELLEAIGNFPAQRFKSCFESLLGVGSNSEHKASKALQKIDEMQAQDAKQKEIKAAITKISKWTLEQ
ncbi:MAG: hypothetical protein R3B74_16660 [Nitrospirales bacterium]|nr:hypothetical protein [Nitrospirales bacterium]